jgi:membrane protein implicated in regulation of membrane protease activity
MSESIMWASAAGIAVILELFTGTFYLLMIAVGLFAGAVAAYYGSGFGVQAVAAAAVAAAATELLRRTRTNTPREVPARDPNMNLDIGQQIKVDAWQEGSARVMYRGALWDVDLAPGAQARAGNFRIVEVRGSRLILANTEE